MTLWYVAAWNPYLDLVAKSLFVIGLADWLIVNEVTATKGTIAKFMCHFVALFAISLKEASWGNNPALD
jgi:hypothetical protein